MNEFAKISVITVCRNRVATLPRALDSVIAQSWPNVEHLLIDGGSADGTQKLLDQYRGKLAYVVSEADQGIYDAMNKGIARATGEVLCFLNADDFYANPQVLATVMQQMHSRRLDMLFGDVAYFREAAPLKIVRRYSSKKFTPQRIAYGWMPAHPASFMRRKIYEEHEGFRRQYRIAGDFEFIARIFSSSTSHYRYEHLAQVIVFMQTGGVSNRGLYSRMIANKEILMACRQNGITTNIFKIMSRYCAKLAEHY